MIAAWVMVRLWFVMALVMLACVPVRQAAAADAPAPVRVDAPAPLRAEALRPDADAGPTRIEVGLWLADISRIDSAAQTFTANLSITLSWKDGRLAHGQPGVKQFNLKDVWNPNWLIVNAASKLEPTFPEIVEVAGDGTVNYRQRLIGTFAQPMDLRAFPFDSASFRIRLVSVGHPPGEVIFVPNAALVAAGFPDGAGIAPELTLQDWRITGFGTRALPYQLSPRVELAGYAFEFKAERLHQHYILKVIVPLLLIVMMSWMVFWIDRSMGNSQISVAVTSMLTLIAYRFAIGNEVPKLPYLTNLDAFILVSTLMVFLALIEVITTTALGLKGRQDLAKTIDRRCRVLFPAAFIVLNAAILLR
jgi:hypothetical protein